MSMIGIMTESEAREKHGQLKAYQTLARTLLLEMRDRKGYLALGFSSFEEYGEKEWNYSKSYLHRLASAAEIQASLSPIGDNKELPESQLRPLGKVPEADREAIYQEAYEKAQAEGKELTAKAVAEAVNKYQSARQSLEIAQRAKDNAESSYKELENRFDHYVTQAVNEKLPAIQQQIEARLTADYQAKIDHQTDVISKLKNDIGRLKNSDVDYEAQLAEKNKQIQHAEMRLSELNNDIQQQQQTAAVNAQINHGYYNVVESIIGGVVANMATLEVYIENDENQPFPLAPIDTRTLAMIDKAIYTLRTKAAALEFMTQNNPA